MHKSALFIGALLAGTVAGCGGGLLSNPSMLQTANVEMAMGKYLNVTAPVTYTFTTPTSIPVTASLTISPSYNALLKVNGITRLSGTFGFSSTYDYIGTTYDNTVTETATTVTSLSNINTVGQSGTLYTSNWTSGGVTVGTETVTYNVNEVSPTLLSFCEVFTFVAQANPEGLTSGSGQACFFIDKTNTVSKLELNLPYNGAQVPFIQQ